MSISAPTARTGSWATWTSRTTASPVTTVSGTGIIGTHATSPTSIARWTSMPSCWLTRTPGTGSNSWSRSAGGSPGREVDELVELYQRVSTHLSMVRSASTDTVLVGRLSALVARARSAVTGAHAPLWSEFARFWTVSFPVVAYRAWRWWLATAVAFFAVAVRHRLLGGRQSRGAVRAGHARRRSTSWSTTTSPTTTARTRPGRSRCGSG